MDKVGLEPALLAKFVLACQSSTLVEAAGELGQTPSALGIALRGLEERLGMHLFIRRGGGLALRPSAFWLFRGACRLLYLEQHIVESQCEQGRPLHPLTIELDLTFAIGRFTKALVRATQQLIAIEPQAIAIWRFAGEDDTGSSGPSLHFGAGAMPDIRIAYGAVGEQGPAGTIKLYDDPWIVVAPAGTDIEHAIGRDPLYYLRMRAALGHAIAEHAQRGGWADRLRPLDAEPSELGDILVQARHRLLVMPTSLLAARMGLVRHEHAPLSPTLVSPVLGVPGPVARPEAHRFLALMRDALAEPLKAAFSPRLTARQVHYFNLTADTGSISAAARAANVSQSSMSANLGRMEMVLGRKLFERHGDGVRLTSAAADLLPLTTSLEQQEEWIVRRSHDIAAHAEARIAIGMLPSSGHDSALTERVARAMARIHAEHPAWRLQIVENSNAVLHDRVRAGDLNLAIVGAASPRVARIPLGSSEQLCVVCHPSLYPRGRREIGLEEACAMPLVLGPRQLSIHQAFADAARRRGLPLNLEVEVGSLPLAIAMVKQARLCTVLPASAVRRDVENGALSAVPIRREELAGSLWVVFSAERELSEAERSIIQELVATFQPGASAEMVQSGDPTLSG